MWKQSTPNWVIKVKTETPTIHCVPKHISDPSIKNEHALRDGIEVYIDSRGGEDDRSHKHPFASCHQF